MTTFQSKVYECSRQNASVTLNDAGTEWINEFKQGIKLEKGDTIRILGSFVNEAAEGDQIEVTNRFRIFWKTSIFNRCFRFRTTK